MESMWRNLTCSPHFVLNAGPMSGQKLDLSKIRSLSDVSGLETLPSLCRDYQVNFIAFGGVVRNLALVAKQSAAADVFDLAPFASDIDLIHTGEPDLTPRLYRALVQDLPFGESLRWQLRSIHDNRMFWNSMKVNNIIPANLMTLSTSSASGIHDRWDGLRDIETRQFRYIRNGFYDESPLYRKGRDIELFSALLYFRLLVQAGVLPKSYVTQPGFKDARQVVENIRMGSDDHLKLQGSGHLRARLRYLTAALGAALPSADRTAALDQFGLSKLTQVLEDCVAIQPLLESNGTLTVSAHLGGDTFRLPFETPIWVSDQDADSELRGALEAYRPLTRDGSVASATSLGPGQRVLLASPLMELINFGRSSSSRITDISRGKPVGDSWTQEFAHFAIPVDAKSGLLLQGYDSESLAVVMAVRNVTNRSVICFVPPPAAVTLGNLSSGLPNTRVYLRINCGGLFEQLPALAAASQATSVGLQVFLLGWDGIER